MLNVVDNFATRVAAVNRYGGIIVLGHDNIFFNGHFLGGIVVAVIKRRRVDILQRNFCLHLVNIVPLAQTKVRKDYVNMPGWVQAADPFDHAHIISHRLKVFRDVGNGLFCAFLESAVDSTVKKQAQS